MSLETDLVARLNAVPALAAAGATASWFELPRYPGVLLSMIWPGREWTHQGPQPLVTPRVQMDVYAKEFEVADVLRQAIQAEMERTDVVTVGETVFLPPALLENSQPMKDSIGDVGGSEGMPLYRWMLEFSFSAKPAT